VEEIEGAADSVAPWTFSMVTAHRWIVPGALDGKHLVRRRGDRRDGPGQVQAWLRAP